MHARLASEQGNSSTLLEVIVRSMPLVSAQAYMLSMDLSIFQYMRFKAFAQLRRAFDCLPAWLRIVPCVGACKVDRQVYCNFIMLSNGCFMQLITMFWAFSPAPPESPRHSPAAGV